MYIKRKEREREGAYNGNYSSRNIQKKVKEAKEKVQKSTRVRIIPHFICASRGTKILSSAKKRSKRDTPEMVILKHTQRKNLACLDITQFDKFLCVYKKISDWFDIQSKEDEK